MAEERALGQVLPFRVKPSPRAVHMEEPVSSEEPELADRLGLPRICPWKRHVLSATQSSSHWGPHNSFAVAQLRGDRCFPVSYFRL